MTGKSLKCFTKCLSNSLQGQTACSELLHSVDSLCAKFRSEKLELPWVKSEALRFSKIKVVKGVNGVKEGLVSQ